MEQRVSQTGVFIYGCLSIAATFVTQAENAYAWRLLAFVYGVTALITLVTGNERFFHNSPKRLEFPYILVSLGAAFQSHLKLVLIYLLISAGNAFLTSLEWVMAFQLIFASIFVANSSTHSKPTSDPLQENLLTQKETGISYTFVIYVILTTILGGVAIYDLAHGHSIYSNYWISSAALAHAINLLFQQTLHNYKIDHEHHTFTEWANVAIASIFFVGLYKF